ncbi:hypothetical protein [Micromonospora sp. NPDC049102]|uniref:hypothetical protein n=1 Tax=Micromonospora sp. NPDC049102 TaxID=3364265 RepID=UPI0037223E07
MTLELVVEPAITRRVGVPAGSRTNTGLDQGLEPDTPGAVGSSGGDVDRSDGDGARAGGVLSLDPNIADVDRRAAQQASQLAQHVPGIQEVFRVVLLRWLLGRLRGRGQLILAVEGLRCYW